MSAKPTIILVPGAWHRASTWNKITTILEAQQYKCISITLPSTLSNPSTTFLEDIEAVRNPIIAETTQGRDVVVVVHSYGGAVGVSATKGLTRSKRESAEPSSTGTGHVIGLVMIATGFVITGLAFMDGLSTMDSLSKGAGVERPPTWTVDTERGYLVLGDDPRQSFYHDLPQDEGEYWVSQLTEQALRPLCEGGEHAYSAWREVPVWYLITVLDRALPVLVQRAMAEGVRAEGVDITVREVESSHSPMLSKPEETAGFIVEAVAYFEG